jgi:hypothetical protein
MSTLTSRRAPAGLAAVALMLLALLAVAPKSEARTIWACVKQVGGAVHIVNVGTHCKKAEVKLSWTGAQGEPGPAGPKGVTGTNGANGVNGASGANGSNGAPGAVGATGPAGPAGGPQGVTGATGPQGTTGATGLQGATGPAGLTGAQGVTGAVGPTGATGATGAAGAGPVAGSSGGPVTASTTVFTGLASQSAIEANVEQVMPATETFTKFYCFGPKPTSGVDSFAVRVDGAEKAKCTSTGATPPVTATTVPSFTISAGELFDVEVIQGDTGGAVTWALAP